MKSNYREKNFCLNEAWCWFIICVALCICLPVRAQWEPAKGPLMTQWAKSVSPDNVHSEYPRPQMVRKNWLNLNGLWQYAIRPMDKQQPKNFDGQILVPFPVESALSGVMKPVGEKNLLWYRRTFEIPHKWPRQRILLHFGAVDWETTVWVNGKKVGTHRGGYDPFTFDVTDALNDTGQQQIVLSVWDPTDAGYQPRGKQVRKPNVIWYTAVTGIWQTVWLEPVNPTYIKSLKIITDIGDELVSVTVTCSNAAAGSNIEAEVKDGWSTKAKAKGKPGRKIIIPVKNPKLWSPDSPFLYDLKITLKNNKGKKLDAVDSYFGMRKIALGKDENGITRILLNNEVLFQCGPLDQGWWPDGLYTAPSDNALRYDIEVTKKLGFNMARKHVKVEPARWYYWCDKLGLLVWQDMPSGDRYIAPNDPDIQRSAQSAKQFELELKRIINAFGNSPSIVMWVPFNEGWGQYDTPRIAQWIKQYDPTRLVDNASGWADRGVGDVHDIHAYPGPAKPPNELNRAAVLGEFGGLGLPLTGHTWQDEKNWGYRSYKTSEELTTAYLGLIRELRLLIGQGLSAAVYTQTTDVEIEINGLMTYDRAIVKMDADKVAAANHKLYLPPPLTKIIIPTSENKGIGWTYAIAKPADGWQNPDFNDSSWKKGLGGFGTKGTPGSVVRTEWNTSDIWLRRTFDLKDNKLIEPYLKIHHDDEVEIYINGQLVASLSGFTTNYVSVPIDKKLCSTLKVGLNTLAVHCHQAGGGQYVDVGLLDVIEVSAK